VLVSIEIVPLSVLIIPYPPFAWIFVLFKFKAPLLLIVFSSALDLIATFEIFKLAVFVIVFDGFIVDAVPAVFLIVKLPLFVIVSPVVIVCPSKSKIIVSVSFTCNL